MIQEERKGQITFKGTPITLVGTFPEIGQPIPDVEVSDNNLQNVKLSSFKGSILILASVPSLDTPVCDLEGRYFNKKATELGENVRIAVISMDLPFAQKRWCGAEGINQLQTFSDYRNRQFGPKFGTLIKELQLLTRAVFIVKPDGSLHYRQYVEEITNPPNYDAVFQALKALV